MSLQHKTIALEKFVEKAMTDYGEYVIFSRAIPKIEDGLKPVQRRILWAMYQLGLKPGQGTTKCARIVGDTIGKYHPHGDGSIYGSLVSLATAWSCKHPFVNPQGNFGSLMGDPPAAYRYTEAGFTDKGYSLFSDEKYFDLLDNFDGQHKEPFALGSPFPVFLTHGYEGIALGFAGAVPSHDLREIVGICLSNLKGTHTFPTLPQLEQPTLCLNSAEEIRHLYETGEGTLSYCCEYEIQEKSQKVLVKGFAPGISLESIKAKLKDLISKELVTVDDFSGETIEVEITVKDTRLFKERVIPALKASKHYSFYAIVGSKIKLLNFNQAMDEWKKYRFTLLERKIADNLKTLSQDLREVRTQILLIENREKFREVLDQEDMKSARAVLSTFIEEDMHDFVLKLQMTQIMKLSLKKLQDRMKDLNKKIKYWKDTTPIKELQIQLEELLVDLPEEPRITRQVAEKDLKDFTTMAEISTWFSIYGDKIEISQDTPTRGRGFNGTSMAECNSFFTVVNKSGGLESYLIHAIPKKFTFEDKKIKPLAVIPDCGGLVVLKTQDGCLFIRTNEQLQRYREVSTDAKVFDKMVVVQPGESLVLKYRQGKAKILPYDQIERKAAQRSIKPSVEMRGFQNPLVDITVANPTVNTKSGPLAPERWTTEPAFVIGKKNFVVFTDGRRQILSNVQAIPVLDQVEQVYRIL